MGRLSAYFFDLEIVEAARSLSFRVKFLTTPIPTMKARKNNRIVAALFSLMAPRTSLTLSLAATATFVLGLQTAQAQRFWDNNGG